MARNKRKSRVDPRAPVDFVILTALEEERDAILSKLRGHHILDKGDDDIHTFYFARVPTQRRDRSKYHVIVTCLLNMGPISATAQTVAVVARWRPRYVLLVGIACGIRDAVSYGDVLIATQVADYTLGKQIDGRRQIRWEVHPCGASLLDSANNVAADWMERIGVQRPGGGQPARHKGVIASGGDVIYDDKIIGTYSESWPKLIGIEMESSGVAAGVHQTPEHPEFLMIKSVSDFGRDKHDPSVKPWRGYASHSAAAFALSVIRSGPARSLNEVKESEVAESAREQERLAIEREWELVQRHRFREISFLFLLKGEVGIDWFRNVLDDTDVHFDKRTKSAQLSALIKSTVEAQGTDGSKSWTDPPSSFWQLYDGASGYWCKRMSLAHQPEPSLVAGVDVKVPWAALGLKDVEILRDLSHVGEFGISIPIKAFEVGVEEFDIVFAGDSFSFQVRLSEHGLAYLHELSRMQHTIMSEDKRMPIGCTFSGLQLLDMFWKIFSRRTEDVKEPKKKYRWVVGLSGLEHAIYFFPDMPQDFTNSTEDKKYTFQIEVPGEIDYEAEIKNIQGLIQSNPTDANSHHKLIGLYYAQGRILEALESTQLGLEHLPDDTTLHMMAGDIFRKLGRMTEAVKHLRQAVALDPEAFENRTTLGAVLVETDQEEAALEQFGEAARLAPGDARCQKNIALAMAKSGLVQEAIPYFERALAITPDDIDVVTYLGGILDQVGRTAEASTLLEKAVEMNPSDRWACELLANHYCRRGQFAKSIDFYERAIALDGKIARVHEFYAKALFELDRWEQAKNAMNRAQELDPSNPSILANLATVVARLGDIKAATTYLKKAVELDPQHADARQKLDLVMRAMQESALDGQTEDN